MIAWIGCDKLDRLCDRIKGKSPTGRSYHDFGSDNLLNIHDNEIMSYEVDLKKNQIILHTQYKEAGVIRNTNIFFYDVLVHFFQNELSGSILFDIEKYDVNLFIKRNSDLLKKKKNYCWPMSYNTEDELAERLIADQYCYYAISSSYGLNGWVLAKRYDICC